MSSPSVPIAPAPAPAPAPVSTYAPIPFDNTFARGMDGFHVAWNPAPAPQPALIKFNGPLARELGLDAAGLDSPAGARIFAGSDVPPGASPLAQVYAGHQFGGFSPQLGDGRALLLGEVIDRNGQRRDIQLKGSGRTPFSRGGDGKAALGPVLREYVIGEAMHALRIPTTRALAVATTGETIVRDRPLPGAVLTRVAASHIRVGTFEFFAVRGEHDKVARLADYVIARHYPALAGQADAYLALLAAVADRQASLVASWMHVGFIHGVMNTDNMSVAGETIDYGPCAFMDRYDPATVFSSIDSHGRYAYANQPGIAVWNLARLAEALLPHIDADQERAVALATEVLKGFGERYEQYWLQGMRRKLGLTNEEAGDLDLSRSFLAAMEGNAVDYTLAFRSLADAAAGHAQPLQDMFSEAAGFERWYLRWVARLQRAPADLPTKAESMRLANPAFIPRNHQVEAALAAAVDHADFGPFDALLRVLSRPFDAQPGYEAYAEPAPDGGSPYRTFCGT